MMNKEEIWTEVVAVMDNNPMIYRGPRFAPPGYFGPWSSTDYAIVIDAAAQQDPLADASIIGDYVFKKMKESKTTIIKPEKTEGDR